jgi:hypothetical protein
MNVDKSCVMVVRFIVGGCLVLRWRVNSLQEKNKLGRRRNEGGGEEV